jgi:sugar-phosphatase
MLRGALFDVDGVLVDSAAAHTALWTSWATMREVDVETLLAGIGGERGIDTVRRVAPHLEPDQELQVIRELWVDASSTVTVFPGAHVLLRDLPHEVWGTVTSGPRDGLMARFTNLGLPVPRVAICGEDVRHGKPHPERYERGCELLGPRPADCVVIEDAPLGIASAHAAGCYVIAVGPVAAAGKTSQANENHADLLSAAVRLRELLEF